ncbi:DNA repair protein RecN [Fusobacterium massiliense]|uniref:DNA repair protein RecN n=1 Tax=Fusobacterium massiliense TaxID=1852365 RepID=UPI0028EA000F|nr:DNA repair protein RecN [Fusobacterium massiliense]
MGRKLMLRELKIENLAIIDELDIEFDEGFIVLTGETGAGKSIILSGINLLIGEKANVDMIRDGEENLVAQGVFDVDEEQKEKLDKLGIETPDNEVIIRRYLNRNGKAKIFVNNTRVSMTDLKEIAATLVDIVGQHSHQMLLNKSNHIKLLDSFLPKEAKEIKSNLAESLKKYKEIEIKIQNIEKIKNETLEKKEFFQYQLEEIEKLKLKKGEDEILESEYKKAFNAEKIRERVFESLDYLKNDDDSALSLIITSKEDMEYLEKYDERYGKIANRLETIYYDLEDCAEDIQNMSREISTEQGDLDKIAGRLNTLKRIKEKYKREISEIIEYRENLKEKLDSLDSGDFKTKELKKELQKIGEEYKKEALRLTQLREKVASKIEDELGKELKFLNMEDAKLKIMIKKEDRMSDEGNDDVEFLISTNVGQGLKSLVKIASGGEVSRVMLALKVIFSKVDKIPILIFDEIDTGVGGETVRKIALKLKEIGKSTQIISITHSPVIASKASQQFYIEKSVENEKTISRVKKLNFEERVKEIGRMLVGEKVTEDILEIANSMLNEG